MANDGFDPNACNIRHLSCRERAALKGQIVARANEERRRLLRHCAMRAGQLLRRAWGRIGELYRAAVRRLIVRQNRLAELRQLAAMSDRELRDIGLSRLEIKAAVRTGTDWPGGGRRSLKTQEGEKHAKGLLDRPRLCS
jgi:uncharacterized protein YjiS (DUF1127 family)